MKHIVFVSNTAWSVYNFRLGLIKNLLLQGFRITIMACSDGYVNKIEALGCHFIPLKNLSLAGTNPAKDLQLYREFVSQFRKLKPDVVFLFTPKPNIYGGMAASWLNIKYINTINGLGYTFQQSGHLANLVIKLYYRALKKSTRVVFQNNDDRAFFLKHRIIKQNKSHLVPGSGVNTSLITPVIKTPGDKFIFLLCSRLVVEKGIFEYIAAASELQKEFPHLVFRLIGKTAIHPSAIEEEILRQYHNKGVIEYLEEVEDINAALNNIDVLVHPSYYMEGLPRILLEGLSKGLPLITTDSVGCRETVKHLENGLLVPSKDVNALKNAMRFMVNAEPSILRKMGALSREMAVSRFSEEIVIDEYLQLLDFDQNNSTHEKPRLLLILNRLIIGGQTFDVIPLAYYLQQYFNILILYGEKDPDEEEATHFLLKYPSLTCKKIKSIRRNINPLYDVNAFSQVYTEMKGFDPHIVHTHGAKSGMVGRMCAKLLGVKAILHTYHGHVFHSYFSSAVTGMVIKTEQRLARYTNVIIALSENQKHEIQSFLKVNSDKIKVVPLGIDYLNADNAMQMRKAFRDQFRLADTTVAIGIVGRLTKIKNLLFFARVVNYLRTQGLDDNIQFFIIGDGNEKAVLINYFKENNISYSDCVPDANAKVIFTSWVNNVQEMIEGLDVVALTSLNEGTPMSLIEAQLCSKPVVAVNVGGVSDTFIDNETGFLIPHHNEELFAIKLSMLAKDTALRNKMSAAAGAAADKKFLKEKEVDSMVGIYQDILKKTRTLS